MPDVKVYNDFGHGAFIGPLHAWKVGDEVQLPDREPHLGEPRPGWAGVVVAVEDDGVAHVRSKEELERNPA